MPKKMKFLGSNIFVTKEITRDNMKSFKKRIQNLRSLFFVNPNMLNEKPEIKMNEDPIICADAKPNPLVTKEISIYPKKPRSQKK